jgi:hypothetical protein
MSLATRERTAPFDMGRVLGRAFALVGARWGQLLLVAVVIGCLPEAALGWANVQLFAKGATSSPLLFGIALIRSLADLMLRSAALAIVLAPAERRPTAGGALAAAVQAVPAMLPFWLLGLVPSIPSLLFRGDPRLMLAIGWWPWVTTFLIALALVLLVGVFNPVVIAERRGFFGALRRSASLMPGGRGKLLALYLTFEVTCWILLFASWIVGAVGFRGDPSHARTWILVATDVGAALERLLFPIWSAISAMAYRELSRMHDGLPPDEISDVFA